MGGGALAGRVARRRLDKADLPSPKTISDAGAYAPASAVSGRLRLASSAAPHIGRAGSLGLGEQPSEDDDVHENQARDQESGNDKPGQGGHDGARGRRGEGLKRPRRREGAKRDRVDEICDPDDAPRKNERRDRSSETKDRPGQGQRRDAGENVAPARARRERRRQFARGIEKHKQPSWKDSDRIHRDQGRQRRRQHGRPNRSKGEA